MWYKESNFRNLVDMHIPDWNPDFMTKFDPEHYADCMAAAGVDTALVYAGNCLGICFFPTKYGHMHEGLHGRDIIRETLDALRARDIRPIVYFNIWSRWAYETHPGWRIRRIDGSDSMTGLGGIPSRFGLCCLNAPGYQEYVRNQFAQLCDDYDFEGMWVDMCGWHGAICTCNHCRAKFYEETGLEIPDKVDFDNPNWHAFLRARERWMIEFNRIIRETVDAHKPGTTIAFQSAFYRSGWSCSFSNEYAALSDYIAGDFYGDALKYSALCKLLSNITPNRPMEFMISRCMNLGDHTTTKTDEELRFSAIAALLHGAAFLFIDAIDPAGTLDKRLYERMGRIKGELKPLFDNWAPEAAVSSEIDFMVDFVSNYDPADNGKSLHNAYHMPYADLFSQFARTMIDHNITYDFVTKVCNAPVTVITRQHLMTDAQIAELREYVEAGGKLIVSGDSGMYDPSGHQGVTLESLTGVAIDGCYAEDSVYYSPASGYEVIFDNASAQYPLFYNGTASVGRITADDVEVLASVTRSACHSSEQYRFASALSNPPMEQTTNPAVTCRRVGKGEVWWMCSPLFDVQPERQRKVFAALVRHILCEKPVVETDAPSWLEVMLRRDDAGKRTFVSLYKTMVPYYDTRPCDVALSVQINACNGELINVLTGEKVPCSVEGGRVAWTAKDVSDAALYVWQEV